MITAWSEYLPRINSLTLAIETDSDLVIANMSLLSPDKLLLRFENGDEKEIQLAHELENLRYKLKQTETTDSNTSMIALRFPAKPIENLEESLNLLMSDTVIWKKSDFTIFDHYTLNCCKCHAQLISDDQVNMLFDLPSDSWAEMMDFWHCHKPLNDDKSKFQLRFKELRPSENSIILGSYYFLINKGDFQMSTHCACGMELGIEAPNGTLKINKWNLNLNDKILYKPYFYAYTVLLDNIKMNASRYFRMVDEETGEHSLMVWVFNFGLVISLNDIVYDNSMKILYYEGVDESFEKVEVPGVVLDNFIQQLDEVNLILPKMFKKMQQWNVSYLYL